GVRVTLPALVALQQAWNDPRTAKLPNILKSRKAPIERIPAAEVAAAMAPSMPTLARRVAFRLPPPRTGAKMIEYSTPEDAAQKLVRILREEAKVFP
ncbi:MAG: electron transfer flavoprotein subunit beta, partial [Thermoplasmata archaeon]|nr:electron transfer flavoprotein subunit beta [Thermoplasmata archaeon]